MKRFRVEKLRDEKAKVQDEDRDEGPPPITIKRPKNDLVRGEFCL